MGAPKGGSSQNPVVGYIYAFGIVMGLSRGPLDGVIEIRIDDKATWDIPLVSGTPDQFINLPGLFGGSKQEGGIQGLLRYQPGYSTQVLGSDLKGKIGQPTSEMRGVSTIYFNGEICAMSPYPKVWKFRCQRTTNGWVNDAPWYPEKCPIYLVGPAPGDHATSSIKSMNAVHALYEALTDPVWGRGLPTTLMNDASWRAAANQCYIEGLGICTRWARTDTIANFISAVIDIISCAVNMNRQTGLFDITLIRGGYDPATIQNFTYGTGLMSISDNPILGGVNTINEVVVSYHDPVLDQDGQVRAHNLASIQALGATYSQTNSHPQVPTQDIASRLALRDLQVYSGINGYKLALDRRGYNVYPGQVISITDPERDISVLYLRVGQIEDSTNGDGVITVTAATDVFGLPFDAYLIPQPRTWVAPDQNPLHIYTSDTWEASYRDLILNVVSQQIENLDPNTGLILTSAARPAPTSLHYNIYTQESSSPALFPLANDIYRTSQIWAPSAILSVAIDPYDQLIAFNSLTDPFLARSFGFNGSRYRAVRISSSQQEEIVAVYNIDINAMTMQVYRGCGDTVPKSWPVGSQIWFYDGYCGWDGLEYLFGSYVEARLTSVTAAREESLSSSTAGGGGGPVYITGRHARPYPPGNLQVNGVPAFGLTSVREPYTISWAHRNRITQADVLFPYYYGDISPEVGTTYEINFYRTNVTGATGIIRSVTGITANSFVYTHALWIADGSPARMSFTVASRRDGLLSQYRTDVDDYLTNGLLITH